MFEESHAHFAWALRLPIISITMALSFPITGHFFPDITHSFQWIINAEFAVEYCYSKQAINKNVCTYVN